jgi:hypothetical protein
MGCRFRACVHQGVCLLTLPDQGLLNGHEWAKRQATHAGIGFSELSNGFSSCEDPEGLQTICDRLGPGAIGVFFERWMSFLPLPLTDADRAAGYWWELSMRQIEVSRTLVFDAPRRARMFFEALVVDNLDIGRPDNVELIFTGHRGHWGRPFKVEPTYKTKIVTRDTEVTVNAFFKHSRIKQYLKDGRALRIESVINSPDQEETPYVYVMNRREIENYLLDERAIATVLSRDIGGKPIEAEVISQAMGEAVDSLKQRVILRTVYWRLQLLPNRLMDHNGRAALSAKDAGIDDLLAICPKKTARP